MSLERRLADLRAQAEALRSHRPTDELARDRVAFARGLGLELDPWQETVLRADSKRDVFNCSRQAGKSTTAAVLALHEAVYRPGSVTVLISPSQRQSSELSRKVIELRQRMAKAPDLVEDNRLSMTVRGGGRVLSLPGSEATVRGISAVTLLVEDEAARVVDELHYSIKPMLATTNGRLLLMSTPFGKRGHYWDVWDRGVGWNRVKVTAFEVPRISREFLEEERRSMPAWWFEQEYLCEFKEDVDSVFRYEDVAGAISDDVTPLFPGVAS